MCARLSSSRGDASARSPSPCSLPPRTDPSPPPWHCASCRMALQLLRAELPRTSATPPLRLLGVRMSNLVFDDDVASGEEGASSARRLGGGVRKITQYFAGDTGGGSAGDASGECATGGAAIGTRAVLCPSCEMPLTGSEAHRNRHVLECLERRQQAPQQQYPQHTQPHLRQQRLQQSNGRVGVGTHLSPRAGTQRRSAGPGAKSMPKAGKRVSGDIGVQGMRRWFQPPASGGPAVAARSQVSCPVCNELIEGTEQTVQRHVNGHF